MKGAVVDSGGKVVRIMEAVGDYGGDHSELAGCPIEGPEREDGFWIEQWPELAEKFGFTGISAFEATRWLVDGDKVQFGNVTLGVRHCPGHSRAMLCSWKKTWASASSATCCFRAPSGALIFPAAITAR